jgi:hypothetical protein
MYMTSRLFMETVLTALGFIILGLMLATGKGVGDLCGFHVG